MAWVVGSGTWYSSSSSSSVVTSVVRSITSWLRPAPRKEPEPEELASDGKICGTLGSGRGLSLLNPVYVSPLVRPWVATLNKPNTWRTDCFGMGFSATPVHEMVRTVHADHRSR